MCNKIFSVNSLAGRWMADKAQVEAKLPQAVESGDIMLRLWKDGDQDQLAKQANSKALWKNVRDGEQPKGQLSSFF